MINLLRKRKPDAERLSESCNPSRDFYDCHLELTEVLGALGFNGDSLGHPNTYPLKEWMKEHFDVDRMDRSGILYPSDINEITVEFNDKPFTIDFKHSELRQDDLDYLHENINHGDLVAGWNVMAKYAFDQMGIESHSHTD